MSRDSLNEWKILKRHWRSLTFCLNWNRNLENTCWALQIMIFTFWKSFRVYLVDRRSRQIFSFDDLKSRFELIKFIANLCQPSTPTIVFLRGFRVNAWNIFSSPRFKLSLWYIILERKCGDGFIILVFLVQMAKKWWFLGNNLRA